MKIVVKIGGAALEDKSRLRKCARAIVELAQDGHHVAVVRLHAEPLRVGVAAVARRALSLFVCHCDYSRWAMGTVSSPVSSVIPSIRT